MSGSLFHDGKFDPATCACNTVEEGWRPCPPSLCERTDDDHFKQSVCYRNHLRPHPAWEEGFTAREGVPIYVNAWRVTAKDATGAEFGFAVMTGDPSYAEAMARALATFLNGDAHR